MTGKWYSKEFINKQTFRMYEGNSSGKEVTNKYGIAPKQFVNGRHCTT